MLFVEGIRDLIFFKNLVPLSERCNASVLPVDEIDIPATVLGGSRGRLLWLADHLGAEAELLGRVLYLVDADLDRFMPRTHRDDIILTDLSDFESYVLNDCSLSHIALIFGIGDEDGAARLLEALIRICKPLKGIRAASQRASLNLPVNRTLGEKRRERLSRYLQGSGFTCDVDIEKLVGACHSNAQSDVSARAQFATAQQSLDGISLSDVHWAQGKDLIGALAAVLKIPFEEASRHITGSIFACAGSIQSMPAMQRIDSFLRA